MKHSLGPYRFEGNKIVCAAGYNVATVNSHATSEGRATGKLLAAAPDMLEALETLANVFPYFPAGSEERAALVKAQAAITKARG